MAKLVLLALLSSRGENPSKSYKHYVENQDAEEIIVGRMVEVPIGLSMVQLTSVIEGKERGR